jgi:hypothetical protein
MNSVSLCRLAGRYDNPIPTRFLAPIDRLKIPALGSNPSILRHGVIRGAMFYIVKLTPYWQKIERKKHKILQLLTLYFIVHNTISSSPNLMHNVHLPISPCFVTACGHFYIISKLICYKTVLSIFHLNPFLFGGPFL